MFQNEEELIGRGKGLAEDQYLPDGSAVGGGDHDVINSAGQGCSPPVVEGDGVLHIGSGRHLGHDMFLNLAESRGEDLNLEIGNNWYARRENDDRLFAVRGIGINIGGRCSLGGNPGISGCWCNRSRIGWGKGGVLNRNDGTVHRRSRNLNGLPRGSIDS